MEYKKIVEGEYGNICSPTTLSQIENGIIIKDNDIYDELLRKLGQSYNYKSDLDDIHQIFGNRILDSYERYKDNEVNYHVKEYVDKLKTYEGYVLEKEIIFALKFILRDLDSKMGRDVKILSELISIYPFSIQILINDKISTFTYNYGDAEEKNKVVKVLYKLEKSTSYRLKTNQIYYLLRKKYYYKALMNLLKIQNYYEKESNVLGLFRIYSIKLILLEEIGSNKWLEEVEKVLPIFKEYLNKDKKQIIVYIYNIAIGCMNRGKYNLALELLILILEKSKDLYLPTAIYINQICTITGEKVVDIANYEKYNSKKYPEEFDIIYKFYLLKNKNTPAFELEKYIFNKIRPIFKEISDDSLYNIFKLELEKCVEKTEHSNLLYKYNRIRKRSS